ncbi:SDR family oxidoreductase [Streptomyces sp. DSM 41524]|uniref:SDR family oxidoreductase n=1 Tax=Streptomyces asiaticus subsp. ignotus TaxID=3098222 RepID=A0ABU7PQ24_9ACTN|nr:SDR family oxidoreductase [Streptomyces sp. DSM 41524]
MPETAAGSAGTSQRAIRAGTRARVRARSRAMSSRRASGDTVSSPEAEFQALRARQPLGRLVTPQEVAHAITYLASPLSASTTGSALAVDGGMATLKV